MLFSGEMETVGEHAGSVLLKPLLSEIGRRKRLEEQRIFMRECI